MPNSIAVESTTCFPCHNLTWVPRSYPCRSPLQQTSAATASIVNEHYRYYQNRYLKRLFVLDLIDSQGKLWCLLILAASVCHLANESLLLLTLNCLVCSFCCRCSWVQAACRRQVLRNHRLKTVLSRLNRWCRGLRFPLVEALVLRSQVCDELKTWRWRWDALLPFHQSHSTTSLVVIKSFACHFSLFWKYRLHRYLTQNAAQSHPPRHWNHLPCNLLCCFSDHCCYSVKIRSF